MSDAVLAMWQRACPASFRDAMARNGLRTEDDIVDELVARRSDLQALYERTLAGADTTSADVVASYEDVAGELAAVDLDEADRRLLGDWVSPWWSSMLVGLGALGMAALPAAWLLAG